MDSAQGYGPWFVGVRIFSGVPYAGVVESGLWRSPRKREAANNRPWVQILPPQPYSTDKIDESAKKPVVTGFFDTQTASKIS